jgi:riboflavin transporter FmnP
MEDQPTSEIFIPKVRPSSSRMIAATGLFGALAILLTSLSQALGLNFPILPYLQFDLGEVAIIIAFLLFGPIPATTAAFVEFLTLMVLGENIPWGPVLKIIAVLSTLGGLWFGMMLA